jgi:prophage antirepressor-like protein
MFVVGYDDNTPWLVVDDVVDILGRTIATAV